MAIEIERKYIVADDSWRSMATESKHFCQYYLSTDPDRTIRVRIIDDTTAYITIKSRNRGIARGEWEFAIPVDDAISMKHLHVGRVISKCRYIVPFAGHTWEVDIFEESLSGLALAEIELATADTSFDIPPFIGREVSDDIRYYNSSLSAGDSLPPEVVS